MVPSLGDKRTHRESTPCTKVKGIVKCCSPEKKQNPTGTGKKWQNVKAVKGGEIKSGRRGNAGFWFDEMAMVGRL